MSWDEVGHSLCPIARALSLVGDRWTLLILRELALGTRRFDDIQAQTGMSSQLLASRLKRLEHGGVVERLLYSERPPRFEYHATPKGRELDPLLLLLREWGQKWGGYGADELPAIRLVEGPASASLEAGWRTLADDVPADFGTVRGSLSPAFKAERAARRAAFQAEKSRRKV